MSQNDNASRYNLIDEDLDVQKMREEIIENRMYRPVTAKTALIGNSLGMTTYSYSLATMSLIDPKFVKLPVMDRVEPRDTITRKRIISNKGYRFANFLSAQITVDKDGKIIFSGVNGDSGQYRDKSFLKHDSQAFETHRFTGDNPIKPQVSITKIADREVSLKFPGVQGVRFVQTVGSRTKTNEDVGDLFHLRKPADQFSLPPIWSTLRLSIYSNGMACGELLYHSLFPSVWFFVQSSDNPEKYHLFGRYHGTKDKMFKWYSGGFGPIGDLKIGENYGNPWAMANPHPL